MGLIPLSDGKPGERERGGKKTLQTLRGSGDNEELI